jgi:hypothetical protein
VREDLLRAVGPAGEAVVEQLAALRAGRRPVGHDHIDAAVHTILRGLDDGKALTTRELAGRLHLDVEAMARSVARLVAGGHIQGDTSRPSRYRVLPFFLTLPPGYAVARPAGKSWKEQIETPCFFPDGTRVVLYVTRGTHRVHDGGAAEIRVGRPLLSGYAAGRGVRLEGGELVVDPAMPEGVVALAQAVADVDGTGVLR